VAQKKLVRFAAIETYSNVLQYPEGMKGAWKTVFKNDHPITLELACGKGEYSLGLGAQNPDRNYIGVDVKGNRIYVGAKKALAENRSNVAFLRVQIGHLEQYFAPGEVDEIWILFPDPFLTKSRAKNRLTHPRFLAQYEKVLKPGATIHLKTDSRELYDFTREVIEEQGCETVTDYQDIYAIGQATGPLAIQTHYEKLHLADGRKIYYLAFRLPEGGVQVPERYLQATIQRNGKAVTDDDGNA
jgi:tRNA (guanine-N7-)-methyltransferase